MEAKECGPGHFFSAVPRSSFLCLHSFANLFFGFPVIPVGKARTFGMVVRHDRLHAASCHGMSEFIDDLTRRLAVIRERGLLRELRRVDSVVGPRLTVAGRELLNFASNDYLGLAGHPALRAAAVDAVGRYGAGSGASRLICGSLAPHHELEVALARFKGTEAALSFSSGYGAAVGTTCALVGRGDTSIIDRLVHACVVDAAKLCGAKLQVFPHNDLGELEKLLRRLGQRQTGTAASATPRSRTSIVTESVFSMDGDAAPLRELVELKERFGAWLMLDEAHATGVLGAGLRGLAEAAGVAHRIEVQMGTLGKAIGAAGGFIAGPQVLVDYLVNAARSFIFSTAPTPAGAAAARAGVELLQSAEGQARRTQLFERVAQARAGLARLGWNCEAACGPILPLILGAEEAAVAAAAALRERGVFLPAIRYPTVARGEARLRLSLTAAHTEADVETLLRALAEARVEPRSRDGHREVAPE